MLGLFGKNRQAVPPVVQRQRSSQRWAAVVPQADRRVRVVAIERETADAVTITVEPCDAGRFIHQPGQYLTHCLEIDGVPLRRAYSISRAASERSLSCTIKQVPNGRVSRYLNAELAVGDEYSIRGPSGHFTLAAAPSGPLLLIAGGAGITPIMSLLDAALANDPSRHIHLIYANRSERDVIFAQRLADCTKAHANLTLIEVLSQPADRWTGPRGRIDAERIQQWVPHLLHSSVFLCGPSGLMDGVGDGLLALGLPAERLHREDFLSASRAAGQRPTQPQKLRFGRSDQAVEQGVGQSILEAGLAAGLALDFSCTVGGCAACKLKVTAGEVVHDEPNCLSDAERREGWILACCAYATGPVAVDA